MEIKLLSCPLCLKPNFDGVDALRSTLVTVATSHLSCPVCSETLLGLDKLTIHLFSHINKVQVSNGASEETTASEEIKESIDNLAKACQETNQNTSDIETPAKMEEEVVRCDICSFSFTDKNILEMHQNLLHQTAPDKKTGTYNYHCHLCSKKFRMRGSLMVHLRVAHYGFGPHEHEGGACDRKDLIGHGESVKVESAEKVEVQTVQRNGQIKVSDNKQWECDVCSKTFTTKYFLKKHKRLHTGEMPYCCTLCNKSFTFQQSYHKHMLYHSSDKPYVCNECGRAFKELSTLQNHARIHSGERPFGCETCGKRFRQRVSYLVHRRIHTGVMPYKCTACEKNFRYKVSQRSHKCPMNPPGSVIRIPETDKLLQEQSSLSPSSSKCIMSVDYNTGNINIISDEQSVNTNPEGLFLGSEQIQKASIMLNNNEQIEISYNKADLHSAINRACLDGEVRNENVKAIQESLSDVASCVPSSLGNLSILYTDPEQDLFSMVLSPILPEVETLCLSNSPHNASPVLLNPDENISIMGEKCLEEFLYGTN